MKYCKRCNLYAEDDVNFCFKCGAKLEGDQAEEVVAEFVGESETDGDDAKNNRLWAALSYIGILFFVGLLARPNSKYVRFHANQGFVLFLVNTMFEIIKKFVIRFATWILAGILGASIISSILLSFFNVVLSTAVFIWTIVGISNAVLEKTKPLPIIGKIRIIK